uniref:Uncharacterized protein n=1 Tax=Sphaerodactylus townsendi TaxID=933632 RepID=A0ACB8EKV9_9SAUR
MGGGDGGENKPHTSNPESQALSPKNYNAGVGEAACPQCFVSPAFCYTQTFTHISLPPIKHEKAMLIFSLSASLEQSRLASSLGYRLWPKYFTTSAGRWGRKQRIIRCDPSPFPSPTCSCNPQSSCIRVSGSPCLRFPWLFSPPLAAEMAPCILPLCLRAFLRGGAAMVSKQAPKQAQAPNPSPWVQEGTADSRTKRVVPDASIKKPPILGVGGGGSLLPSHGAPLLGDLPQTSKFFPASASSAARLGFANAASPVHPTATQIPISPLALVPLPVRGLLQPSSAVARHRSSASTLAYFRANGEGLHRDGRAYNRS